MPIEMPAERLGRLSFVLAPQVVDGFGKSASINRFIGHQPISAAGNSDGDLQMHQCVMLADGLCFALILPHAAAEREWA